jgi:hypothetical protein
MIIASATLIYLRGVYYIVCIVYSGVMALASEFTVFAMWINQSNGGVSFIFLFFFNCMFLSEMVSLSQVDFSKLEIGEVFEWKSNMYYMMR